VNCQAIRATSTFSQALLPRFIAIWAKYKLIGQSPNFPVDGKHSGTPDVWFFITRPKMYHRLPCQPRQLYSWNFSRPRDHLAMLEKSALNVDGLLRAVSQMCSSQNWQHWRPRSYEDKLDSQLVGQISSSQPLALGMIVGMAASLVESEIAPHASRWTLAITITRTPVKLGPDARRVSTIQRDCHRRSESIRKADGRDRIVLTSPKGY